VQAFLKMKIEESFKILKAYEVKIKHVDFGDWEQRLHDELDKLIYKNGLLIEENFEKFRGLQIYVADQPVATIRGYYSDHWIWHKLLLVLQKIVGSRRGAIQETMITFKSLEDEGNLDLLAKYPNPDIGKPCSIHHRGYKFTNRHLRHIYILSLFNKKVVPILPDAPSILDIGCSYGFFSSLVKKELPESKHVLVDMPGQLLLAHYFLLENFPNAKIADFKDVANVSTIDRDFIDNYDFILLPTSMYDKLLGGTIDLVTNFVSFAEMSQEWFWKYFNSAPITSAPYLYTINRYDGHPTYTNDITILDYPFMRYETVYMRTCPIFHYYFESIAFFGTRKKRYPSEFFQFIGRQHKTECN